MGLEAVTKALLDAGRNYLSGLTTRICSRSDVFTGITYDEIQTAFVGYCYGDTTSGQVRFS